MPAEPTPTRRRAAVVVNPTKVDVAKLKKTVNAAAKAAGWLPTVWLETTATDSGAEITGTAVRRSVDVVIAVGGDGTVRSVAEGLRDSGVALALLPSGTGNLLARNLDLPLNDVEASLAIAFGEGSRKIDLGIADIIRDDGDHEEHVFLVMAGLGIDAKMIKNTSTKLKKAVGWLAYIDGITRSLPELKPVKVKAVLDGRPPRSAAAHSVLIGNCGALPGGILVMPEAKPDDGILDIAVLRPQGPFGWLAVWRKIAWQNGVLRKSAIGRKIIDLTQDVRDVTIFSGRDLLLTVETPQDFQLDGDEFGEVRSIHATVDAGALTVKVPA